MSALSITPPFPTFAGKDGLPLEDGYIWLGAANLNPQTNPLVAYWDETLTQIAQQPIRTLGGYPAYSGTPARLFISAAVYSILVQDKNGNTVYTSPSNTGPSTFINFSVNEEVQVATAGQTVFTLANNYTPGTNSLTVYVDGVNQYDGAGYSFVETNGNTVTFTSGLHVGALVKFSTAIQLSAGVADSSQITYNPAGTGAVTTNVQTKLRETVSVKDFGAVGDGVTDDTVAIQAAIDYANTLINPAIFFPAGHYRTNSIIIRNSRSLSFIGEGFKDPVRTSVKISPISNVTNLFDIRSCSYFNVQGIYFNADNKVSGSLVVCRAGGSEVFFGSAGACAHFTFDGCVFHVGDNDTVLPDNPVLLSNSGAFKFTQCFFKSGSNSAIQLGELNPVNPDTGNPTLGSGFVNQIEFDTCLFQGDVYRLNTTYCRWVNCNFYGNVHDSGRIAKFAVGTNAVTAYDSIDNCYVDAFITTLFAGVWYEGGLIGGVIIQNSQLGGRDVLVFVNYGSLQFFNNRLLSLGSASFRRIIVLEENAGAVDCWGNNTTQIDTVNNPVDLAKVGLIDDRRLIKYPVVFNQVVKGSDITITNVDQALLTTTYKPIGQRFRIKASLVIKLTDTSKRNFVAKFVVDGTTVPDSAKTITLSAQNDFALLNLDQTFFIDQKTTAVNFSIFMQSTTGTTTGVIVQDQSVWQLELVDF